MGKVIVVTGASSGFGALTAGRSPRPATPSTPPCATPRAATRRRSRRSPRFAGDTASICAPSNSTSSREASADAGVAEIVADSGRIDVVVHNAGHMVFGPAEAFTPEQSPQLYDINVLGTQRVNRAALPHLRRQGRGCWSGCRFAAHARRHAALPGAVLRRQGGDGCPRGVQYAGELARWGIETSIIVPGAFTKGTNHFAHAGTPADAARVAEYEAGPYAGFGDKVLKALAALEPADADPSAVADAIVKVVGHPLRQASVPGPRRSVAGRRRCRLHRAGQDAFGDAASRWALGPPAAEGACLK